jgi:hypothetical protein
MIKIEHRSVDSVELLIDFSKVMKSELSNSLSGTTYCWVSMRGSLVNHMFDVVGAAEMLPLPRLTIGEVWPLSL